MKKILSIVAGLLLSIATTHIAFAQEGSMVDLTVDRIAYATAQVGEAAVGIPVNTLTGISNAASSKNESWNRTPINELDESDELNAQSFVHDTLGGD